MRKAYYIEFTLSDYESDPPYLMQSVCFDTKKEAKEWFWDNFDYCQMNADLMEIQYFGEEEEEYEIDMVCRLK